MNFGINPHLRRAWALLLAISLMPAGDAAEKPFGNPWGMQLRRVPSDVQAVMAPVIVREAPTNESSIVARRDGTLEIYSITKPESNSVSVLRSRDGGLTWSGPEVAFPLPGRAYYAVKVVEAADGALHAVFHIQGTGSGGYRGRLYEVYHVRRAAGADAWSAPQRVVPGYVGSIRGFIQMKSGRLLFGIARAIPEREQPPASGPDFGWHDTFVYFSDDQGVTWRQSPDRLKLALATQNATRYGAIEPVLLELRDGRAWMLVRDRGGRLWQSYSADGERWVALERSPFISSDSPAELLRLRDGKILLLTSACQFWANPRTYAMGGREVLQAGISADDGQTWRGFRDLLHETNHETKGDRGSAYASAAETRDGKVVVVSGQGEGKRAILIFDPRWLMVTEARDELGGGPEDWTQYGAGGLHPVTLRDGRRGVAIPLERTGLGGALWNFPLAEAGELRLRLDFPATARELRLCLSDHFNRIDDTEAAKHAVFAVDWNKLTLQSEASTRAHDVRLIWRDAQKSGMLIVEIDGKRVLEAPAQRAAQLGVNYLRIEFQGAEDDGEVTVSELSMRLFP